MRQRTGGPRRAATPGSYIQSEENKIARMSGPGLRSRKELALLRMPLALPSPDALGGAWFHRRSAPSPSKSFISLLSTAKRRPRSSLHWPSPAAGEAAKAAAAGQVPQEAVNQRQVPAPQPAAPALASAQASGTSR